ncbi:MAG: glycoside hydrolase family 1 protein [Candidatus Dormibacteria bacterium]
MARLPDDFLLGSASAAHQVEGGLWNDWMRMEEEEPERILDGSSARVAIDHFHRYREDLELLASLHQNAQRFSIEWSRVEPQPGCFDPAALAHYADVIATCHRLGMEPVVTLQHFTLPVWLADRGGLLAPDAPRLFARFAAACAVALGAGVRWWVTVNEPNVLCHFAYNEGYFPPHQRSTGLALAASRAMLRMHVAASTALHTVAAQHGRQALVGLATHERRLRGAPGSPLNALAARLPDFIFNRWMLQSLARGRMLWPVGRGESVAGAAESLDFIGLNYYCEDQVVFDPRSTGTLMARTVPFDGAVYTTFGSPVQPEGLQRALTSLWAEFGLPILITESGVADNHDELRAQYIVDHLRAVVRAREEGVDVRGYLYWTGFDNFEWLPGYSQKFGLVAVDRETLTRTPKPSSAVYAEICRTRVVS